MTAGGVELDGTVGDDVLQGGECDDLLQDELGGDDEVYGEGGDDLVYVSRGYEVAGSALIDGGAGRDQIFYYSAFYENEATILGGDDDDVIDTAGGSVVSIDAGAGDDLVAVRHEETAHTVTLGTGADVLVFSGAWWYWLPAPALHVTDFEAGADGDRLVLAKYIAKALDWDTSSNPFATGHLALVQVDDDAVLRFDRDGGGDELMDLVVFEGVDKTTLTAFNLDFSPDGLATPPIGQPATASDGSIFGGAGNDGITGGDDGEWIFGGAGDDELFGGGGWDRLDGQFGDDYLDGGAGGDIFWDDFDGDDHLVGGAGDDAFLVSRAMDSAPASTIILDGGADDDWFHFRATMDRKLDHLTVLGGDGNDDISIDGASVAVIDAGEGDDVLNLVLVETDYTITLGAGADEVRIGNHVIAADWPGKVRFTDFAAGAAGDRIEFSDDLLETKLNAWDQVANPFTTGDLRLAQSGADALLQVDGDGGDDSYVTLMTFSGTMAASLTAFNLGDYAPALVARLGTSGADRMVGSATVDSLDGLAGNDVIDGRGGADRMDGGAGNDLFRVDHPLDRIIERAGEGDDRVASTVSYTLAAGVRVETLIAADPASAAALDLTGNEVGQTIHGNAGNNVLDGGGGNDSLHGFAGIDTLIGGSGADVMRGGLDRDRYYVDDSADRVLELAGEGDDVVFARASFALGATSEVESLLAQDAAGTAALDLGGSDTANSITGNAGANVLRGNGGGDLLIGLAGSDVLDGGAGADNMRGGAGNDVYRVDNVRDRVIEAVGAGDDTVLAAISYTLASDAAIEALRASDPASAVALDLTGNDRGQSIAGNEGANIIEGGGGVDVLDGHGGSDVLNGGTGADNLRGGAGQDDFRFDSALGSGNVDRIFDYSFADDRILLDNAMFTQLGWGALSSSRFHVGGAAADPDDHIVYNAATGALFYDADGSGAGAAVQFARLDPGLAMSAGEFVVI